MDPATVALLIKGLDVAFTLANYYMNREQAIERKGEMLDQMKQIAIVRERISAGDVTEAQAGELLDGLKDQALEDMRAAMMRL